MLTQWFLSQRYYGSIIRSVLEISIVFVIFHYFSKIKSRFLKKRGSDDDNKVKLTEQEIDDLVDEWTPEPLVADLTPMEEDDLKNIVVLAGPTGTKCKLSNGKTVTNLASLNHYNLVSSDLVKENAISALRTYGVGPCGPPGFYGTQDVHMRAEADIAAHMGTSACILYAQAFSTISSVIPAFSKKHDVIVADKAVNYPIRKGIQISKSKLYWYEHNDTEDMERVLAMVAADQDSRKGGLTRRFLITEAIFENVGDTIDLVKIIELKYKYKFRLILDESLSYGVLGYAGRGITDAQHVDPKSVDMIIGNLSGALCAAGGFCAGSLEIVEHQRLNSASYTFSAAMPAIMATTASVIIGLLQEDEGTALITQLRENIRILRAQLEFRSDFVRCRSWSGNPVLYFEFKPELVQQKKWTLEDIDWVMKSIVEECVSKGVLISRMRPMPVIQGLSAKELEQEWQPVPALKVSTVIGLSRKEIEAAGTVIRNAIRKVVNARR